MRMILTILANILLFLLSWVARESLHGDEYLFLFMISLVFMVAPYALTLISTAVLFFANLLFLAFYYRIGVLNLIDVFVMAVLLAASAGASYLVKMLRDTFIGHYKTNIQAEERKYNNIVNELDAIDRRGRKIENELNRMSRLYEITKCLAPALKVEELFDALFEFLRENFMFKTAHFLTFSKGKFSRAISKNSEESDYCQDDENVMDYEAMVKICEEKEYKQFFVTRQEKGELFNALKIRSDTFMAFPMFAGDNISAILAIEGASRSSHGRFRILTPQISLEFRKVELYEQVQKLSIIDGLTEVYLRRYLMGRLEEEVDRARRLKLTFSIGMVDVDHFKKCNDEYGHLVGDVVLKKIAERLKRSVREVDMIARYGGEEFCIVLPETTKEIAMTVSERLRNSVAAKDIKAYDEKVKVTVSAGLATYPEDGEDVETLIEKADTALYKAKRKGRNRVCTA